MHQSKMLSKVSGVGQSLQKPQPSTLTILAACKGNCLPACPLPVLPALLCYKLAAETQNFGVRNQHLPNLKFQHPALESWSRPFGTFSVKAMAPPMVSTVSTSPSKGAQNDEMKKLRSDSNLHNLAPLVAEFSQKIQLMMHSASRCW